MNCAKVLFLEQRLCWAISPYVTRVWVSEK